MAERPMNLAAAEAARILLERGEAAGATWTEIVIAMETTLAIVLAVCAVRAAGGTGREAAWAGEILDTLTERAHGRVAGFLNKELGGGAA